MTIYPAQSGNVTPDSLVYNGKPQKLVVAGKVEGGTLQYFVGKDAPLREAEWEDDIPTATDAGKYTVWYRVKGDANHNDSDPASVVAKIAKAPISLHPEHQRLDLRRRGRRACAEGQPRQGRGDLPVQRR